MLFLWLLDFKDEYYDFMVGLMNLEYIGIVGEYCYVFNININKFVVKLKDFKLVYDRIRRRNIILS